MSAVEILETVELPLDDLAPFPGNARRGNLAMIRESVRAHGQYRSIVVRDTPDGKVILAGNHTAEALRAEGHATARCEVVRCDDQTAVKINLADNRAADAGGYDDDALIELLRLVADDLEGSGYHQEDLDDLLFDLEPPAFEALAEEVGEPQHDDLWPVLRFKVPATARADFYAITNAAGDEDDTARFLFLLERAGKAGP